MPPFLFAAKKATALLEQWVKTSIVQLAFFEQMQSQAEKEDVEYCPYHCKNEYTLEQHTTFKKLFGKKLKAREIIFQNEGALHP